MVYSTTRFVLCLTLYYFVLVLSVPLALRLSRLGKRELISVLFVRLFGFCLFRFVGFLLGSGKGCGLWLWHSLGFSLTFIFTLCWFVVYSTRRFVLCLTLCYFVLVFSVPLALRLPCLEKRELILELFVRLFDLCLFGFVCFLFLLVSGKGYGLWLWHSLDWSNTPFF